MPASILETTALLREKCAGTRGAIGGWCTIGHPFVAEVIAGSGFDWLGIDCQHGLVGQDGLLGALQAAATHSVPALVRVSAPDETEIGRALDLGANGVIVPMVDSADQAHAAGLACRYAPRGVRSWGPTRAGQVSPGYTPAVGDECALCIVMIETRQAVDAIDAIAAVPDIDGVFVGASDLSISFGVAPGFGLESPIVDAIETVRRTCRDSGLITGIYAREPTAARAWLHRGFGLIALGSDLLSLREHTRQQLELARRE